MRYARDGTPVVTRRCTERTLLFGCGAELRFTRAHEFYRPDCSVTSSFRYQITAHGRCAAAGVHACIVALGATNHERVHRLHAARAAHEAASL